MDINKEALSGAQKICNSGTCISGYDCGRPKDRYQLPLFNEAFVCPLSRYEIGKENNPHLAVTEDEIFALCAECENTGRITFHENGDMTIRRKDLSVCADCIVKMIQESNAECAAEARMS